MADKAGEALRWHRGTHHGCRRFIECHDECSSTIVLLASDRLGGGLLIAEPLPMWVSVNHITLLPEGTVNNP